MSDYGSKRLVSSLDDAHDTALLTMLLRARSLFADVCDELVRADPEAHELCLLLSNRADGLATFISGINKLMEATS